MSHVVINPICSPGDDSFQDRTCGLRYSKKDIILFLRSIDDLDQEGISAAKGPFSVISFQCNNHEDNHKSPAPSHSSSASLVEAVGGEHAGYSTGYATPVSSDDDGPSVS